MNVAALMNEQPSTCRPEESLHDAARKMWELSYGCLPVVNKRGKPVGMLTDRDICVAAYMQEGELKQLRVDSAMSRDVVTCRPNNTLTTAERVMRKHRVPGLAVALIDDGRVIIGRIVNLHGDNYTILTDMLDPSALTDVRRDQIEMMRPSPLSMMPTGL
jgi:CBS domain-containing protein